MKRKTFARISALVLWFALLALVLNGTAAWAQPGGGKPGYGGEGPAPDYDNAPFIMNRDSLPRAYLGHNAERLYNAINSNTLPGVDKSAFIEHPDVRTFRDPNLPLAEPLKVNSVFAFEVKPAETSYNARVQTLQAYYELGPVLASGAEDKTKRSFTILHIPELDNSYFYTDTTGKRVELREVRFRDYMIAFGNFDLFSPQKAVLSGAKQTPEKAFQRNASEEGPNEGSKGDYITGTFTVPTKDPVELREGVRLLAIGRLVTPYVSSQTVHRNDRTGTKGEYTAYHHYIHIRLLEVWFYDFQSGKIYLKMKPTPTRP